MVHGHIGDHRDQGHNHIGGIQSAAQPSLEDHQIQSGFCKPEQGQGGGKLEVGYFFYAQHTTDPGGQFREFLPADKFIVDPETFPDRAEMGRGIEANPISGPGQQGQKSDTHRPLAVGAGHMHIAQLPLRMADPGQKRAHGVKAQLDLMKLQSFEIELCFLVVHLQ